MFWLLVPPRGCPSSPASSPGSAGRRDSRTPVPEPRRHRRAGALDKALGSFQRQAQNLQGLLQPENMGPVFETPGSPVKAAQAPCLPRRPQPPQSASSSVRRCRSGKESALCKDSRGPPRTGDPHADAPTGLGSAEPRSMCCVRTRLSSPDGAPPPKPASRLRAPMPTPCRPRAGKGTRWPPGLLCPLSAFCL